MVNKVDAQNKENILIQSIFDSFKTRKFKREQPSDENLFFEVICQSVKKNEPIKFVTYWWKGERNEMWEHETQALEFLHSMFENINQKYTHKTKLSIIYTDTHARINGFNGEEIELYERSLRNATEKYGYNVLLMSDILKLEKYSEIDIESDFLDTLVVSASKHYKWNENIETIAKWYYQQNQNEKKQVAKMFENHIFLTYNGRSMNQLFPEKMPIFYMYSTKRGNSEKPWFKE